MKKKILAYAVMPVLGLSVAGATAASAHGLFGMGMALSTNISPSDLANRQAALFQQEASILGVSVDDVKSAWASGKSYLELAKEKGISQETIQARLKRAAEDRYKQQLSALVAAGVITQAQADQRFETMQNKIPKMRTKHMGRFGLEM